MVLGDNRSPGKNFPGSTLSNLLEGGLSAGVFTAAVALVGLKGELLWQGAAGWLSRDPESPPVTLDTVFDLASLTKPLATALALMLFVSRGELRLDTALGRVLEVPWLSPDKYPLTLKSLLAHRAGLPAWRPYYRDLITRPPTERPFRLARLAAREPLEYPPDTATLYSDLGYMLLEEVIRRVSGQDLDTFCRRELYLPLGLKTLGFNPKGHPGGENLAFAATETGLIPGRDLFGEVHDENAWAAGGVAGHAGLFGRGPEVFALVAGLWRAYHGEAFGPFRPEVVRDFLTPVAPGCRTPGFDVPTPGASSAGRFFSRQSVGHTGFTGTSFWLDLKQGQMVVLLTNRVHLGRHHDQIKAFRPRFHEAASRALSGLKAV
jgi:CubicO group peptidase (beta-lactamase class C family)